MNHVIDQVQSTQYNPNKPVVINEDGFFLDNIDIPGRPTNWVYISLLLFGGMASFIHCFLSGKSDIRVIFIPQMIILILIISLWLLKKINAQKPYNILSPDIFFVSIYCVFHFAYIFFYAFNLVGWDPEVFWVQSKALPAVSFSLWGLIFFLVGYELPGNKFSRKISSGTIVFCSNIYEIVGKTFIFLAIVFFWGTIFSVGIGRVFSNYTLLTNVGVVSSWGRLYAFGYDLCSVGIVMFCAFNAINRQKAMSGLLFILASCGYMFGLLLTGDRGGFLQFIVIPIIAFHYFQRKIKFYWIVGMFFSLFFIMAVVGITRTVSMGDIKKTKEEFKYVQESSEYNAITRTLLEFGSSIKTVNIAMALVPDKHSHWYGQSYIDSTLIAIPNIIPGYQRMPKGIAVWITETAFGSLESTWGRGGSIAMEAYMNFGYAGILVFLFFGVILRNLYEKVLNQVTFFRLAMLLAVISGMVLWIRNTFTMFIRCPLWTFVVVGVIYLLTKHAMREEQ